MAVNFETQAKAMQAPSPTLRRGVGSAAQESDTRAAAATVAQSAMSVLAMPASARIGGRVVNRAVAIRAAAGPPVRKPQKKTTNDAVQKNGNIPLRASASTRS